MVKNRKQGEVGKSVDINGTGDSKMIRPKPDSAEAKALRRIQDTDHSDLKQCKTLIEEGQEVDVEKGLERLKKRGYKIQIPSSS